MLLSGGAYSTGVYQSEGVTFWIAVLTTCFRNGGERNTLCRSSLVGSFDPVKRKPTQRTQQRKTIPLQRSTRGAQAGHHRAPHLANRAQARSPQSPLPTASAYSNTSVISGCVCGKHGERVGAHGPGCDGGRLEDDVLLWGHWFAEEAGEEEADEGGLEGHPVVVQRRRRVSHDECSR